MRKLVSLLPDVDVLSCSTLLLRNGSGLDRSSPKQETRCLQECRTEEGLKVADSRKLSKLPAYTKIHSVKI